MARKKKTRGAHTATGQEKKKRGKDERKRSEDKEKTGFKESTPVLISYKKKPWPKDKSDPIQIENVTLMSGEMNCLLHSRLSCHRFALRVIAAVKLCFR